MAKGWQETRRNVGASAYLFLFRRHENGKKSYQSVYRGDLPPRTDGCVFRFHIDRYYNPYGGLICHITNPYICIYCSGQGCRRLAFRCLFSFGTFYLNDWNILVVKIKGAVGLELTAAVLEAAFRARKVA